MNDLLSKISLALGFVVPDHSTLFKEWGLPEERQMPSDKAWKDIFAKWFANSVRRALNKAGGEYWKYLRRSGGLRGNKEPPRGIHDDGGILMTHMEALWLGTHLKFTHTAQDTKF